MCPGISKNMHGYSNSLKRFSFCKTDGVLKECSVRTANKSVFVQISLCGFLFDRIQIMRQEVKSTPYSCDFRKTCFISFHIHKLHVKLRCCKTPWSTYSRKQCGRAVIYKLCAVANIKRICVGITCEVCSSISCIVMKIFLHDYILPRDFFMNLSLKAE